jgi:hypothetical protein
VLCLSIIFIFIYLFTEAIALKWDTHLHSTCWVRSLCWVAYLILPAKLANATIRRVVDSIGESMSTSCRITSASLFCEIVASNYSDRPFFQNHSVTGLFLFVLFRYMLDGEKSGSCCFCPFVLNKCFPGDIYYLSNTSILYDFIITGSNQRLQDWYLLFLH